MRARSSLLALALLVLVARLLLALGPDGMVLCVHEDGGVFVESTSELCCARAGCKSEHAVANDQAPTAPDDGCDDYALTTGSPLIAHEPAANVDLTPMVLAFAALDLRDDLSPSALDRVVAREVEVEPLDPAPPRSPILRC